MENITAVINGCIKKEHKYQKMVYGGYFGYSLKLMFRYIYRYEKAVDLVNDGFVKLFKHFERFQMGVGDDENEKMMMGYIKRIMVNCAIDELRKNKMTPEIGGIPEYVWNMSSKEQDADQQVLYKELIIMIKNLQPQYRAVFNMYVVDGYNHLEIADILGIAVGTDGKYFDLGKAGSAMPANTQVLSLNGSSKIIEIPFRIKYDFITRKKSSWFISTGVSSYILTKEHNDYAAVVSGSPYNFRSTYPDKRGYFSATANISFGSEFKTGSNNNIKVRIEPFLQLPLHGIGIGAMPVYSTGVHLGIALPLKR